MIGDAQSDLLTRGQFADYPAEALTAAAVSFCTLTSARMRVYG